MIAEGPHVIVVQGGPAVGKTTVAHRLSQDIGFGLLGKDDFKELFFEKFGAPYDRDDSRIYGRAAMSGMFAVANELVKSGKDIIMESTFHTKLAERDFGNLHDTHNASLLQVFCHTDRVTQELRWRQRARSERHASHLDDANRQTLNFEKYESTYARLAIEPTIDIDTTNFRDAEYNTLLEQVNGWRVSC